MARERTMPAASPTRTPTGRAPSPTERDRGREPAVTTGITKMSVKGIRCLEEEQAVTLPRVTLLVGENSTGKTTFLACCQALAELAFNALPYKPFGREPLSLGEFDQVAHNRNRSFELGGHVGEIDISLRFAEGADGNPTEQSGRVCVPEVGELRFDRVGKAGTWRLAGPTFTIDLPASKLSYREFSQWLGLSVGFEHFPYRGDRTLVPPAQREQFVRMCNHLTGLTPALQKSRATTRAVSPELPMPTPASHADLLLQGGTPDATRTRRRLRRVKALGQKTTLFDDIRVVEEMSGYVTQVKVGKRFRAISDVGLGVHSALPFLVEISEWEDGTVLLQQPEAHLHPRGEALLAQIVAEDAKRYVIETHSDFIINRLQICVQKELMDPADLKIVWFERTKENGDTDRCRTHEIRVDEAGNIRGAPRNYREFFITETETYIGLR